MLRYRKIMNLLLSGRISKFDDSVNIPEHEL